MGLPSLTSFDLVKSREELGQPINAEMARLFASRRSDLCCVARREGWADASVTRMQRVRRVPTARGRFPIWWCGKLVKYRHALAGVN